MTLIEALTGPDGIPAAIQSGFTLHARFRGRRIGRFPVVLLINRIGDVGVEIVSIALFHTSRPVSVPGIGFTSATKTVFTLGTRFA